MPTYSNRRGLGISIRFFGLAFNIPNLPVGELLEKPAAAPCRLVLTIPNLPVGELPEKPAAAPCRVTLKIPNLPVREFLGNFGTSLTLADVKPAGWGII